MPNAWLADVVVVLHFTFIVFAVGGGVLVSRWPRLAWLHVPAFAWAVLLSFFGWPCPLTPLEQWLREQAGQQAYSGSFIAHYLLPVIYPAGLTREIQVGLGTAVLAANAYVYGRLVRDRW